MEGAEICKGEVGKMCVSYFNISPLVSNVLYEEALMKRIIDYVMQKFRVMSKDSSKVVQLLEILSAFCTCKGAPVQQNQCKYTRNADSCVANECSKKDGT